MESARVVIDKYIIFKDKEKLGGGQYGEVYLGQFHPEYLPHHVHQNTLLAIKISVIPENDHSRFEEVAKKEIEILLSFKNDRPKHIVQFIDAFKSGFNFYTVMEYCNQKNLSQWINDHPNISEREIMNIFSQIVKAFEYLFKRQIMHRDLKLENILMHNYQVKLCDFGMAKHFQKEQQEDHTIVGTEGFLAPELFFGIRSYTYKADIWSLGIILYYMLFKQYYWDVGDNKKVKLSIRDKIQKLFNKAAKSDFPPFPSSPKIGPMATHLLRRMLAYSEEDRIDWNEIFEIVDKMGYYNDNLNIYTQPEIDLNQQQQLNSQLLNLEGRKKQGMELQVQSCILSEKNAQISNQFWVQYYSKEKMMKQARQVTARFDYEWQICRFIFQIIKSVIKLKSLIPLEVFLGIEFLLNKRIFLHFTMLKEILHYKKNVLEIEENQWNSFLMCQDPNEYQKTCNKIEEDFKIYESNFKSIPNEILDNIHKLKKNEQEEIQQILKDIASMEIFIKDLENYCIKLLKVLKPNQELIAKLTKTNKYETVLYLIDDLFILLTIKTSLKWEPDHPINIYKFYENRKQLDLNILKERIDKAYAFLEESESQLIHSQAN